VNKETYTPYIQQKLLKKLNPKKNALKKGFAHQKQSTQPLDSDPSPQ